MTSMYEEAAKAVTVSDEGLHRLANQAQMLVHAQETLAQCEADLKIASEMVRRLEEQDIPNTMQELGVETFTLTNGAKISVSMFYSASIPDDTRDACLKWLETNGYGAFIKNEIACRFDREGHQEATALMSILDENGVVYSNKETVHAQTMKKLYKDTSECTDGTMKKLPEDLFNLYMGKKAKVVLK